MKKYAILFSVYNVIVKCDFPKTCKNIIKSNMICQDSILKVAFKEIVMHYIMYIIKIIVMHTKGVLDMLLT